MYEKLTSSLTPKTIALMTSSSIPQANLLTYLCFVLLYIGLVAFTYDHFSYPTQAKLLVFISQQVELVNRHNRYEMEHGFTTESVVECTVPLYRSTMRKWWLDYTRIEEDVRDKHWRARGGDICNDYPLSLSTSRPPTRLGDRIGCHTVAMHNPYPYDGLFVAAKYCHVLAPRPLPVYRIINQTKYGDENVSVILINLEISLPNGTLISGTDDRLKFWSTGQGCNFTILPNSSLILHYTKDSGDLDSHKELRMDDYGGIYAEWIRYNPHCGFRFDWNMANPILDSPNVSEWLIRRYQLNNPYTRINLY